LSMECQWETEVYTPINAPRRVYSKFTDWSGKVNLTVEYSAQYEYDTASTVVTRGDQEFRVWRWALLSSTTTVSRKGTIETPSGSEQIEETTTQTIEREIDFFTKQISKETIKTITSKNGEDGRPEYDVLIIRTWDRDWGGRRSCLMVENEYRWERREIGQYHSMLKADGTPEWGNFGKPLILKAYNVADWVQIHKTRTVVETYGANGECTMRVTKEIDDDGNEDILNRGISTPYDDSLLPSVNRAKFSAKAPRVNVEAMPGGTSLDGSVQTLELPGRRKVYSNPGTGPDVGAENWYIGGNYGPGSVCPHYDYNGESCKIHGIPITSGDWPGNECPTKGYAFRACVRAVAAVERAAAQNERKGLMPPVLASEGTDPIWAEKQVFVDAVMDDATAQGVASDIAANLVSSRMSGRGMVHTVTVPLDADIEPNGCVLGVTHNLKALTTTVSYLTGDTVPPYLLTKSAGTLAGSVFGRESAGKSRTVEGRVVAIDPALNDPGQKRIITVMVAGKVLKCSTKLMSVAVGDGVQVRVPAGNTEYGVIERLL